MEKNRFFSEGWTVFSGLSGNKKAGFSSGPSRFPFLLL
jgi:hypothetical protein